MPATEITSGVSYKDLSIQQKEDIKRRLTMEDEIHVDFEDLFTYEAWPKGQPSITYRTLLPYKLDKKDISGFRLLEYTAPQALKLEYVAQTTGVKDYGTRVPYSWQAVEGNADSVVADATINLRSWNRQLRTRVYAEGLLASRNYLADITTGTNKIIEAFELADIAFSEMHVRPIDGGNWRAYMPARVAKVLKNEYLSKYSQNLPEGKKAEIVDGYVTELDSFTIVKPTGYGNDYLTKLKDDGTLEGYYIIFVGLTETGIKPGKRYGDGTKDGEIIFNPLGSGVVRDAEGNIVPDSNHQEGSIAMNVKYFDAHVIDDRAVLKVFIKKDYMTSSNYETGLANVTGDLDKIVKAKTGYKGAYFETHTDVAGQYNASPIDFLDGQTTTVAKSSSITLALSGKVSEVASTDTGKATVTIDEDPTKVKVTGVAAGTAKIIALDSTKVNAATIDITVTCA